MKKLILILLIILSTGLFIGCGVQEDFEPLTEMPSMAELSEYYDTHTKKECERMAKEVQSLIDATSDDEILSILKASLQSWADTQSLLEIDHVTIDFTKDELLMNEQANQKAYNNFFLKVGIYYDPEKISGNEREISEKIFEEASKAIGSTPYGSYKTSEIETTCFSLNNIDRFKSTGTYFPTIKDFVFPQAKEELKIQTIAYNYADKFNSEYSKDFKSQNEVENRRKIVTLRRFGIMPQTSELYIEIPIYKVDFDKDISEFERSLEGKGKELYDLIGKSKDAKDYLQSNDVKTIKISFYTPWSGNIDYVFDVEF